jgi:hypothetical protein
VATFLGTDRGIKRLGVTPLPDRLSPIPDGGVERGPSVNDDATLREALAMLLDGGTGWVAIRAPDGTARGILTLADIEAAAATGDPSM